MESLKPSKITIGEKVFEIPPLLDQYAFKTSEGEVIVDFTQISSRYGEPKTAVVSLGENVRRIPLSRAGTGSQDLPQGQKLLVETDEPIFGFVKGEDGKQVYWENPRWA